MPGKASNLPAAECKTGAKLVKIPGSVCHECFARKGNYARYAKTVQPALYRRLDSIRHPQWVDAMVTLLERQTVDFRWHDSGDLQSVEHLNRICQIASRTPNIRHWLPTREYKIVTDYRKVGGTIPANLTIRLSAHMVDGAPPTGFGLPTSTVSSNGDANCPAPKQGNKCGDCRRCWNPAVQNVAYGLH